jgi:N-acetylglutamate synthase-like GNAT family acetyltransferase
MMMGRPFLRREGASLPVREATVADIDALTRLVNTAYAVEHFIYDGERVSQAECADLLTTGKVLLLEQDESLVGCIYLELRKDSGYVGLLSVKPSHQNQGIGRSLVTIGEARFRSQGRKRSELQVVNVRTELLEYYRRLGYREFGTAPWPADVPTHISCHFVKMIKAL